MRKAVVHGLFIVLPIIILIIDFLLFPTVIENFEQVSRIDIVSLLTDRVASLGIFRANQIHVAVDNIYDDRCLNYIKKFPNGLLISYFIDDSSRLRAGPLGTAVLWKLSRVSPDDKIKLLDLLDQLSGRRPGEVVGLELSIPDEQFSQFPVDYLFIVLFEEGSSVSIGDRIISQAIAEVFSNAERKNISTLIIPCLGYNWEDKNSIKFDDLFHSVFESVKVLSEPRDIFFSLYSDWPTFTLEEAINSLNKEWERNIRASNVQFPVVYRARSRLTLLLLAVCLLASSFQAPLNLKNFLIITSSFIASVLALTNIVDFITQGYSANLRLLINTFVMILVATGFPFFIRWNPRDIFIKSKS